MITSLARAPFRLASSAVLLSLLCAPGDLKLKENDHKSLSRLVDAWYTANRERKDADEAMKKVIDQIASFEKRLKGQDLLASVADWEQVFRLVTESRLKETLKKKGEVEEKKIRHDNDIEVLFGYCVPKKPAKGALPLILAICDSGELPVAHLNTHWNDPVLRESAILMAVQMSQDVQSWGVFGTPDSPGGVFTVMTALGIISSQFPVDANRTFLVGSGKGFAAAETTAAVFPHVFAGLVGIGDVAITDPANLANFRILPTLLVKCAAAVQDGEPGIAAGAQAIEAKIKELGFNNCTLDAGGGAARVWEWIGKSARVAYPAQVSFSPRSDYTRKAHWISLGAVQVSENPHVEAKADRATNTITVEALKVSDLVIYLNDEIADLDKPVKFMINGTAHEQTVERSAPEMIRNQYVNADWGRVYTASVTLDVPSK